METPDTVEHLILVRVHVAQETIKTGDENEVLCLFVTDQQDVKFLVMVKLADITRKEAFVIRLVTISVPDDVY